MGHGGGETTSPTDETSRDAKKTLQTLTGPPTSLFGWRGRALTFFRNPVDYMLKLRKQYGNVATLTAGDNEPLFFRRSEAVEGKEVANSRTVFVFGAEANRALLTQLDIFETRKPRGPETEEFASTSDNILFANGQDHRRRRKLLMPVFSRGNLQAYHTYMAEYARQMLDSWSEGKTIELDHEMSLVSMNIASKCLYGLDPVEQNVDLAGRMRRMIRTMFSPAALVPLNFPGTPYHRLRRDLREIRSGLQSEVRRMEKSGQRGDDVLSIMIERHMEETGRVDVEEIVGEAFVMFFAGHDTTSKALCWTLYLLAQHPEVARELHEELENHVEGDAPTYEQLFELDVLDRVVKESLRVLSPAVMFPRVAVEDTEICGFEIPQGSELVYSSYVTHMDPEVFPQPRRFDPSRWHGLKPSPYEYLPFGAGRRTCLGAALGTLTIKLLVPMILKRFQLQVVPGARIDLDTNVVNGPKPGIPVIVHRQDGVFERPPSQIRGYLATMVDLSRGAV